MVIELLVNEKRVKLIKKSQNGYSYQKKMRHLTIIFSLTLK